MGMTDTVMTAGAGQMLPFGKTATVSVRTWALVISAKMPRPAKSHDLAAHMVGDCSRENN